MSQLSTVPNASSPRSARARAPGTLSRIQRHLGRREIRIQHQPGLRRNCLPDSTLFQSLALASSPPVLPHNRRMNRLARRPLPHNHRLALVRDADRRHIARTRTQPCPALPPRMPSGWSGFRSGRAPPIPPADRTARTRAAPLRQSRRLHQKEWRANSSCPGPVQECKPLSREIPPDQSITRARRTATTRDLELDSSVRTCNRARL